MYDFWHTLGRGIIDPPGLLAAINGAKPSGPDFYFCQRLTTMIEDTGPVFRHGPSTGKLIENPTSSVRMAISKYVRQVSGSAAPPIGLYCAGRFCQLIKIKKFRSTNQQSALGDILNSAQKAYVSAIGGKPSNLPTLPAFLGLCMLDGQLADAIRTWPNGPQKQPLDAQSQMIEIAGEFGIVTGTKDWNIVVRFVNSSDFQTAVDLFMNGDNNPWAESGTTLEQAMFWPDMSEYAIP